jgi:zinc transporter ZupT
MVLSSSTLPLLAVCALFLRRNLFKGFWKMVFLCVGLLLLTSAVYDTLQEHGESFTLADFLVGAITASVTLFILSRFNHNHVHTSEVDGAKGIVISEAFHSLIDGAVIGATYLVSPLLGYAATLGIVIHELPKIIGTVTIFRSLGLSMRKTITYGIAAQIGSPVSAMFVYLLGKKFDHEQFHALEISSISSLAAIVLWIIYLEVRFHMKQRHNHVNHHEGHNH